MQVACLFVLLSLAASAHIAIGIRVEIPGRCPEVCKTDVESVFFGCMNEVKNECALELCDSPARSVKCGLKSGVPKTVYTGEEVKIFDFQVSRSMSTMIGVEDVRRKVDIYFLIDGTGSMGSAIAAFRNAFIRLTTALKKSGDFAYGVGVYRDETELNMGFMNLQQISTNVTLVKEKVKSLKSKGGDDTEEANLVALYKLATEDIAKWREGAGRVIVLFGDAVGHEPTCFGNVTLNRGVVTNALKNSDITVEAISPQFGTLDATTTRFGCETGRAPRGQTSFIANGTGGNLSKLGTDNAPTVIRTFTEVLGSSPTVIDIAENTCGSGLKLTFDPPLPTGLAGGQRLKTTLRLRRRVCRRGSFECKVSFSSGDSVSSPLRFKIKDPSGC